MMNKTMRSLMSAWRRALTALSATALALLSAHAQAQQVMQLVPGQAPSDKIAKAALDVKPGEALRIENLRVNDASPKVVNLELHRSEVVSAATQYTVFDDKGPRSYPLAPNAHFVGIVQGQPDSYAYATVTPQGEIRTIIHQGQDTVLNELLPAVDHDGGKAESRAVDHNKDFVNRNFACGVTPTFLQSDPNQQKLLFQHILRTGTSGDSAAQAIPVKGTGQRRADIIVDSDYEFFQLKGTESATFNYIVDLFTYVGSRYQAEVNTRFNLKQIVVRSTTSDPWTATTTDTMLTELRTYWNTSPYSSTTRNHVHLLSGKNAEGGIAYINTLGTQSYAYGVSASLAGNFNPSNPQVIWDSVVVAHEIGHAFGSSHTHEFDNPAVVPSPNPGGGAIDCCYSPDGTSQCGTTLGGPGKPGFLPGIGSITGGGAGQRNGTIMSYCHLLNGGMGNIAWSFGTGQTYGVNASRVPTVMTGQAQTYLPLDTTNTYDVYVTKAGAGAATSTVTSAPAGINCGIDCTESFTSGTSVTLTATPGAGYIFAGWSGSCTGTGACTLTMDSYKGVTATFTAPPSGLLSIAKFGTGSGTVVRSGGSLNCGSTCTESFALGATVALTATPAAGSTFAGWSGGTCSGTGSCAFTINANTTVNAQFNTTSGGSTSTPLLQSNLSGVAGSTQYFSVTVPAGASNLVIQMSGGTGDADLYVKLGQVPTLSSYDCRPYINGNTETCTFASPVAGVYYIMISGYQNFDGLTLSASYQKSSATKTNIIPVIQLLLLD